MTWLSPPSETPEAGNCKDAMGWTGGGSMRGAKAMQKIFPWGVVKQKCPRLGIADLSVLGFPYIWSRDLHPHSTEKPFLRTSNDSFPQNAEQNC